MATNVLDKLGSIGALIAGAAVPCCFPFLSLIGGILGLSFLAPYEKYVMYAMQVLVLAALAGSVIAYRGHRKIFPLLLSIVSTAAVLYAVNTDMSIKLIYGGMAGLIVVAIWNSIEARRCAGACNVELAGDNLSTLTCPRCLRQETQEMPTNSCTIFWQCPRCGLILRPRPGACCIFCSYGSVDCPPKIAGTCC